MILVLCISLNKSWAGGESCGQAYTVVPAANYTQVNFNVNSSDKSVWFTFQAIDTVLEIFNYETAISAGTVLTEIHLYSGTCGSLNEIDNCIFDYKKYGQRQLLLNNLTINTTYFVKGIAAKSNSNLSISFIDYMHINTSVPCTNHNPSIPKIINNSTLPIIPSNSTVVVGPGVTVTLGANITINNCIIEMGTNAKLIAPAGVSIKGGTRIYSCSMWQGIDVTNGDIAITENSMISDAINAVNIITNGSVVIHEAIFNRNNNAIIYQNTVSSQTAGTPIYNSIITSRNFGLSYLMPNPIINFLKSPDPTTGLSYLEGYPITSLLNSNLQRPYSGIRDYHTFSGALQIGQLPIGEKDNNIFEAHYFGIISKQTKTYCINNILRYMPGAQLLTGVVPYVLGGIGILADGGNAVQGNNFELKVGDLTPFQSTNSNTFFNCYHGISSSNYSNNIFTYNDFSSDNIANTQNYLRATQIYPAPGGNTTFENNSVNNLAIGVRCYIPSPSFTFTKFSFCNNYINVGPISSTQSGGGLIFTCNITQLSSNSALISNNTISGCIGGIILNSINFKTTISNNVITNIGSQSPSTNAGQSPAGINLFFSTNTTVMDNTITGNYTNGAIANYSTGIYLTNSKQCKIQCNTISNQRHCFVFEGTCTATKNYVFTYNSMKNCKDGLVLLNSGAIGKNGSTSFPSENYWDPTGFFDRSHSLADLSDYNFTIAPYPNPKSYFYTRPLLGLMPTVNKDAASLFIPTGKELSPLIISTNSVAVCGNANPPELVNANNLPVEVLKQLMQEGDAYPVLDELNQWINKRFAFEQLQKDSLFMLLNDSIINAFEDSIQYENVGAFVWTDELIQQYNYYYARYVNNGITAENTMEQNQQIVNRYYINWCENPNREFSTAELTELYSVANQCANLSGKAVLQAQAFLDYILQSDGTWNNTCPIPVSAFRKAAAKQVKKESKTRPLVASLKITPNPLIDKMQYTITGNETPKLVQLFDLAGEELFNENLNSKKGSINLESLKKGAYIIEFTFESGSKLSKKLILVK